MSWHCFNCGATVQDGMIHGCMDVSGTLPQNNYTVTVVAPEPQTAPENFVNNVDSPAAAVAVDQSADTTAVAQSVTDTVATSATEEPVQGVNE